MTHVYVVVAPTGFIWGIFASEAAAHAEAAKHSEARVSHEPVIGYEDPISLLLRAKDAIEALDGTTRENEKLVDDYRAAIAKVGGAA